jgi:hypothetical protein
LYKRLRIARGTEPDPLPFHLDDGTIIYVPRTQMKGLYSLKTHNLVLKEPDVLEFTATKTAKIFTLLLFLCGLTLIIFTLAAGLSAGFIFGGILLLAIGAISSISGVHSDIFLDKRSGMLSIQKTGPLMQNRPLIIALSDIAAIQVLAVEIGNAYDVMVTSYEINLVYAIPAGERNWLVIYGNLNQAKQAAVQLAKFLNRPILEHTAF